VTSRTRLAKLPVVLPLPEGGITGLHMKEWECRVAQAGTSPKIVRGGAAG
jgi:hypothetical protein